jgi:hypothetical protein
MNEWVKRFGTFEKHGIKVVSESQFVFIKRVFVTNAV